MPCPNEIMPVYPTSRLSEVAKRPIAAQRITKSSSALLLESAGSATNMRNATSAIRTSR